MKNITTISPPHLTVHSRSFMHFYVQTNNSFERVNFLDKMWAFLPIGNQPMPVMFACDTGYGDGTYEVQCDYRSDVPVGLSITFIADNAEA